MPSTNESSSMVMTFLSPEIWSEILHFLPPTDVVAVSNSALLQESSTEIVERAAWLALSVSLKQAVSASIEISPQEEQSGDNPSQRMPSIPWDLLALFKPGESYLQLYDALYQLQRWSKSAVQVYNRFNMGIRDAPDYVDMLLGYSTFWLLFGGPELSMPLDERQSRSLRVVTEIVSGVASGNYRMGNNGEERYDLHGRLSPLRILQVVRRIADNGNWEEASSVLRHAEGMLSQHGTIMTTDAKILASTFWIDQVYASTYVNNDDRDSQWILDAVLSGREAVQKSLEIMMTGAAANLAEYNPPPQEASQLASSTKSPSAPPTALTSLFSTPKLRLAAARVALARALASMGQHVGLGATDPRRFHIPLVVTATQNDFRVGAVAESLFHEGLHVIQSCLTELDGEVTNLREQVDMDILQVWAATVAARGELLYCASSVNTQGARVVAIRNITSNDNEVLSMQAMLRESIGALKHSFHHVGKVLTSKVEDVSVAAWCTCAPRSLMLVQCQTAKDLGKVINFAVQTQSLGLVQGLDVSNQEAASYLTFANTISSRLNGKSHPSTGNIERLLFGLDIGGDEVACRLLSEMY